MPKFPLAKSNPFLRDAADLKSALLLSVSTSTAIEGVHNVLPKPYRRSGKKGGHVTARESGSSYGPRR
jgi:hypothetical protein